MDQADAMGFAQQWCADWNAHDLDALLRHVSDDVVFTSPVAQRVLGSDGVVTGKAALGDYWSLGLAAIPDLHFTLEAVYSGIATLVITYRNQAGNRVCEVLHFDGELVRAGHGTYLDTDNPEGSRR
jgi:hypothetical protein